MKAGTAAMTLRWKILIGGMALVMAGGCATAPRRPAGVTRGSDNLQQLCDRYNIELRVDPVTQVAILSRNRLQAVAMVDSPVVLLGEDRVFLRGPLQRKDNAIVVPKDFQSKVIDRLTREVVHEIKKFRRIIVDAGHGGKDPGAIGASGIKEKTVVLDIARRLARALEKQGIEVIMTRESDEFISLQERTEIASRVRADLFVSIHANASRSRSAKGVEVFYLRDLSQAEKDGPQLRGNQQTILQDMKVRSGDRDVEEIVFDMMYSYKQTESRELAEYVMNSTPDRIRARNRGIKQAGFFVLKNTLTPAILVEVGFLTNPQEEKLLNNGWYRQKIAETLAETIIRYAQK